MSNFISNKNCPYCQTPIKNESEAIVCPKCYAPHHPECWEENGGCTTFGCSENSSSSPGINVGEMTPDEAEHITVSGLTASVLINCPKCKGLVDENSVYCKFCGNKFSDETESNSFDEEFQSRYRQKAAFHRRRNILAMISAVVLISLLIIATIITINELEIILTPEYPEQEEFINNWIRQWESKNLEAISGLMTEDYQYKGPDNKTSNKSQKLQRLKWTFKNYSYIDVKVNEVRYNVDSTSARIEFNQRYESDKFSEEGKKKLFLRKTDESWKLYREEFR